MAELAEIKAVSNDSGEFIETIKFKVLHCGNVSGNNNKFYCLEIQRDPKTNTFRLFSHYGRLGKTDTYGIRDGKKENRYPITDQSEIEKVFDFIIAKKKKGKTIKEDGESRIEKYEEVETIKPTVGSTNICNKTFGTVQVKVSTQIDKTSFDPIVSQVIDQIIQENIHNITSLTSLKLTSNGFETPLGPVTKEHVQNARIPLNNLQNLLKNNQLNKESKDTVNNNNLYFSLIPHLFGHKIQESDWILDNTKLATEFELLDNLETAVQMGSSLQQNAQQKVNALGTDIEVLKDKKDFDRIVKYIEGSKAHNHHGTNVWRYKIKNIFKIKIPFERTRFESKGKQKGNLKELFHGSKNCNILSILKNGLIIPPTSCATYSGRAFGDGVYFANNSTKSLNYSIGFWGGSIKNKFNNAFLFLADVAMGKMYEVTYGVSGGAPKNYDSIYAKKGSGLYNDEFIVYDLAQATLTYLVEMI